VIEAGCGHDAEALMLARRVKGCLAFDAVPEFIALAEQAAAQSGVDNVRFVVIHLAYLSTPQPGWNEELPESLRMPADPEQLYKRLAWRLAWDRQRSDTAPYVSVRDSFMRLFEKHACGRGLSLRQRRFLWKAIIGG
jgi:hypothetical protein